MLVLSLSPENGLVLDPYLGSGSAGVGAIDYRRNFIGAEIESKYRAVAKKRLLEAANGTAKVRLDIPVKKPNLKEKVAQHPKHFIERDRMELL